MNDIDLNSQLWMLIVMECLAGLSLGGSSRCAGL